mgnify:CR=1 FL=1
MRGRPAKELKDEELIKTLIQFNILNLSIKWPNDKCHSPKKWQES